LFSKRIGDLTRQLLQAECLICSAPSNSLICKNCQDELDAECFDSYMTRCPYCYMPLISQDYICPRCHSNHHSERDKNSQDKAEQKAIFPLYCVADYNANLSYSLLHRFKFLGDKRIAKIVALYLQKAVTALDPMQNAYIVPVPCSKKTLKNKGWDHMVEVCKHIDRPTLKILENTQTSFSQQKLLDRQHRLENKKEAQFTIVLDLKDILHANKIKDLSVPLIVVDDVCTTSSTIQKAISVLHARGFENVKAAVWLYDYKA